MTNVHNNSDRHAIRPAADDAFSGSSLVPMLVTGLVLIVIGMIAVAAFV